MATERFEITDGPSKWDLIISLFHGDHRNRNLVFFMEKKTLVARVIINKIERTRGNADEWKFEGYDPGCADVSGLYSTKTRKGWLDYNRKP